MLWQLKKLSTNEPLSEPGPLPNNWGPIFGMPGLQEKLGDLSWLGDEYADKGWVQVEGSSKSVEKASDFVLAWEKAKNMLRDSDWAMLSDSPLTVEERQKWVEYRAKLRNIRYEPGFPDSIVWPVEPS